jgi:hypothetical protein
MYENGKGVPQDFVEAVKWHRLAAEQGDAESQFRLAVAYAQGQGLPRSEADAVKWLSSAAEKGHAGAQKTLGLTYASHRSA